MSQIRFSISTLGQYLEPQINAFLQTNIDYMKTLKQAEPEIGAELKANAISYGISLAMSSPIMKAAFAVGVAPPPAPIVTPGGPIGTLIYNVLTPNLIEI